MQECAEVRVLGEFHHAAVGLLGGESAARAPLCEARGGALRMLTGRPAAFRRVGAAAVATTSTRAGRIFVTS